MKIDDRMIEWSEMNVQSDKSARNVVESESYCLKKKSWLKKEKMKKEKWKNEEKMIANEYL